jgi:predicted Zn-ribbon and HTH transcriptional regulator
MDDADQADDPNQQLRPESCIIPPALPKSELHKLMFRSSDEERREIIDYVEWQSRKDGDKVLHAEKIASERVLGTDYGVWDVHTDASDPTKSRWWVITSPTNLYSQTLMPSLDYTLSFHIGLMARVGAANRPQGSDAEQAFIPITTRYLLQAHDAFDAADEAADFQAVGMRCRETLLTLVREVSEHANVPVGDRVPKIGDFVGWSDLIANHVAGGGSAEFTRGYLKNTADRAWRLVNWVTHARNATREDARLAVVATSHVVDIFALETLRQKVMPPERCLVCGSQKIETHWRPDLGPNGEYVARCEACGAEARKTKVRVRLSRGKTGKSRSPTKKKRSKTKR